MLSRERFFILRKNVHLIDNTEIPKNNTDKCMKIRPLYDAINKKINSLPVERKLSVGEQMVPYKVHLQMK